jgi:hypothetical protein
MKDKETQNVIESIRAMGINPNHPAALGAFMEGQIENAIIASTPGGIEASEEAGQRELCAKSKTLEAWIPIDDGTQRRINNDGSPGEVFRQGCRPQLEKLGFKFFNPVTPPHSIRRREPTFYSGQFPPGWFLAPDGGIEGRANAMHSNIIDHNGNKRGSVFFKAAFYDYNATIRLYPRYETRQEYSDNWKDDRGEQSKQFLVVDRVTGENVYDSGWVKNKDNPELPPLYVNEQERKSREWLNENYPDHEDPLAYWPA